VSATPAEGELLWLALGDDDGLDEGDEDGLLLGEDDGLDEADEDGLAEFEGDALGELDALLDGELLAELLGLLEGEELPPELYSSAPMSVGSDRLVPSTSVSTLDDFAHFSPDAPKTPPSPVVAFT
jgi:hypothetical protein